jgi:glucose/arabinose dehydrogenase
MAWLKLNTLLAASYIAQAHAQSSAATSSGTATATSCSSTIAPRHAPSVAPGYSVQVVASGLKDPRGIIFDSQGHLLVVQQGYGISVLNLTDDGGACVRAGKPTDIILGSGVSGFLFQITITVVLPEVSTHTYKF